MTSDQFNSKSMENVKFVWEQVSRGIFVVLTLLIAVLAFQGRAMLDSVADHEKRITTIEANRYTSADALRDQREMGKLLQTVAHIVQDISEIKENVKEVQRTLQSTHPPGP